MQSTSLETQRNGSTAFNGLKNKNRTQNARIYFILIILNYQAVKALISAAPLTWPEYRRTPSPIHLQHHALIIINN